MKNKNGWSGLTSAPSHRGSFALARNLHRIGADFSMGGALANQLPSFAAQEDGSICKQQELSR